MNDNLRFLISSSITIIGFVVTIITMIFQFRNSAKSRRIEEQRKVYAEVYLKIEPAITNPELLFERQYYETILGLKGLMKLYASNSVIHKYESFLNYVYLHIYNFELFCKENMPESFGTQSVPIYDDQGNILRIEEITDEDEAYAFSNEQYLFISEHAPEYKVVKAQIDGLLNCMRKDLGYGAVSGGLK